MTWSDVNLEQKIVRITAKPQWNWKPKDCEERSVPIPEWLANELAQIKSKSCSFLLFPNQLADLRSDRIRSQVDKTFANCVTEPSASISATTGGDSGSLTDGEKT